MQSSRSQLDAILAMGDGIRIAISDSGDYAIIRSHLTDSGVAVDTVEMFRVEFDGTIN